MEIKEAAQNLHTLLKPDGNVQVVGIRGNNREAFKLNPQWFREEIKEDSLVVYTLQKPTPKELTMTTYEGFPVAWVRMGRMRLLSGA